MFRRLICNLFYYCVVDLQYRHHNHHHHHHFIIYDTSSMLAFPRVTSTCSNLIYTRHILRRHNTQQPTSILRNHITGHIHTPRIYRVARSRRIRLSRVGVTSFRHCARPLDCLRLWIGLAIFGGLRYISIFTVYGFLFVFCSNYGRILSRFDAIHERDSQTATARQHTRQNYTRSTLVHYTIRNIIHRPLLCLSVTIRATQL